MRGGAFLDPTFAALLHESLRLLIILALPMSAAVFMAGFLAAALQGFARIHDHVIGYTFRALAVVITTYLIYPTALEGLSRIVSLALGGNAGLSGK